MVQLDNTKLKRLIDKLKELFQLDQPELDFGIYRIMHAKAGEVTKFLEKDLLPQVREAFAQFQSADGVEAKKKLEQLIAQLTDAGVDPQTSPKVQELRAKVAGAVDIASLENEVYDHLYTFFRRYYSEGDFLSKRVYKEGVYAIPYEGEEVKLYWANHDQYYIKTSEYLRDYAFRLRPDEAADPMRVHFKLVDAAEGEHGNVKVAEGKERQFILAAEHFIGEEAGELSLRFEYRPARVEDWPEAQRAGKDKPPSRDALIAIAEQRILATNELSLQRWLIELQRPHTTADGEQADYSRLVAHLRRYTARHTFDYFIHKDLGGFLRRELDFYIKNEVMRLDDAENESAPKVEQYLSKIKAMRRVAVKIIEFLAQLEEFQKKLWLKKKFVVKSSYCVRLGYVPESLYPEIIRNEAQHDEWVSLFRIDEIRADIATVGYTRPLTLEFLKSHPSLMLDTKNFSDEFADRLLDAIDDLDESIDGILIHAENFQALNLIQNSYSQKIKAIYIDPPYNTDAAPILYKNDYKNSSWLSMMQSRLGVAAQLLRDDGIICVAIDDEEVAETRSLLHGLKGTELGVAVVRANPQSRKSKGKFSPVHEYALFFGRSDAAVPGNLEITEGRLARYPKKDEKGSFAWMNFIRTGNADKRADRPKMHFPIVVNARDELRIPAMRWSDERSEYLLEEELAPDETIVYPTVEANGSRVEKRWHRGFESVSQNPTEYRARRTPDGKLSIDFKTRMDEESLPSTWWDKKEYASANYGASQLKDLFGEKSFDYPKALGLVVDCLKASNLGESEIVIDFFAGSGTTGHAVVSLNREDGGRRKFVLVESAGYFDSVVVPRIKKVVFSSEWKDARPTHFASSEDLERSPRMLKVLRLESYEDSIANLKLRRTAQQESLLSHDQAMGAGALRERYLLQYQLEVESRGSPSLLKVEAFDDPTAYKLKVKSPGLDESSEVNIDLVETFNWLLGLSAKHISAPRTFAADFTRTDEGRLMIAGRLRPDERGAWWFRTIAGTTAEGRKTLIIWRKLTANIEQDNLVLEEWFSKQGYSTKDSEFQLIYVNGGSTLENLKSDADTWKVRLIEEDFHRLMFDSAGE